jgi:hypothetical protein
MDAVKIRVRQDLERMVINYFLRGDITEDQSARICDCIDNAIGGGNLPEPYRGNKQGRAVIPFPTTYTGADTNKASADNLPPAISSEIYAPYGEALPEDVEDFRETLQRDGLVLICYQKLVSREGAFFDVLWAQSNSRNEKKRRVCQWSGPVRPELLPYVFPMDVEYSSSYHEKCTLVYTVNVAPENVMKGPITEYETYIEDLKKSGLQVNFDYVFNFGAEKRNRFLEKNKELFALKLPTRIINALNDREIYRVKDLKRITVQELRTAQQIGERTLNDTLALLEKAGIKLMDENQNMEAAK